jgi:hypothetical protein
MTLLRWRGYINRESIENNIAATGFAPGLDVFTVQLAADVHYELILETVGATAYCVSLKLSDP